MERTQTVRIGRGRTKRDGIIHIGRKHNRTIITAPSTVSSFIQTLFLQYANMLIKGENAL